MLINSPLSVVRKKCSSSRFELNRVNRKPGRDLGEPRGGSPGKSRSSEWEELYVYWNCLWIWYRSITIDCEDIVCARISRDLVPYRERTRWTIGGLRGLIDRPTEKQCAVSFFFFFYSWASCSCFVRVIKLMGWREVYDAVMQRDEL